MSYPVCVDLYAYANGDPLNYFDPDGRFASPVYQPLKATFLNVWNSPQFHGAMQMGLGVSQTAGGAAYTAATGGFGGLAGGGLLFLRGLDDIYTGARQILSNDWRDSGKSQLLQACGASRGFAEGVDTVLSFGSPKGASRMGSSFLGGLFRNPVEKQLLSLEPKAIQQCLNEWTRSAGGMGGRITGDYRKNLIRYTGFDPGKIAEAHHVLPQVHRGQFLNAGINIDDPKYLVWVEKKLHRAISRDYNKDWKEFFRENNNPDRNKILQMGKQTRSEIGIPLNY